MILSIIIRLKTSIDATFSRLSSIMVGLIYASWNELYLCIVIGLTPNSDLAYLSNSLFIIYT